MNVSHLPEKDKASQHLWYPGCHGTGDKAPTGAHLQGGYATRRLLRVVAPYQ